MAEKLGIGTAETLRQWVRQAEVDWFNNQRPHDYLDDLTPVAAEQLHYAHKQSLATVG